MTLPLRHGSLPARYRANKEKNHGHRKGFLKATAMQKAHIASACKKPFLRLTGKQQAEYSLPHENPYMRACACWRQNKTSGGWYPWPDGAGQHYIIGIMQSVAGNGSINTNYGFPFPAPTRCTVLHNAPLCKVRLWRATFPLASPPSSPARGRAVGQPRSGRLRGLPTAAPRPPVFPKPYPEDLAKPDQPHQLAFAPGCHAFCKQKERAAPALRSLQAGAQQQPDAHVIAANHPAGVPARRTFT